MRALRYGVVGAACFAIDLGCLLLFVDHMPLLAANTLAFLIANIANFWMGHVWVFGRSLRAPGLGRQYAGVLAVSLVGVAINDAVVWAGVVLLGVALIVAKVIATLVAMVWNYAARSLWIYRKAT
jgi:putative flippase GtrA